MRHRHVITSEILFGTEKKKLARTDARSTRSASCRAVRALVRAPGGTSVLHFHHPVE